MGGGNCPHMGLVYHRAGRARRGMGACERLSWMWENGNGRMLFWLDNCKNHKGEINETTAMRYHCCSIWVWATPREGDVKTANSKAGNPKTHNLFETCQKSRLMVFYEWYC